MGKPMAWRPWGRRKQIAAPDLEEALARAARLGITPDRVLEEYRRIAFANLRHIVEWNDGKMEFKPADKLDEEDVAAIAEIVQSAAKDGKPYRVKLYDKKAALDAIARYLGMTLPAAAPIEDQQRDDKEDPREALIREMDRLAAKAAKGPGGPEPQP
jgi:hypothetical protein